VTETTEDRFLDGRVTVRQPSLGFRAGLDAVMLAAAIPAESGDAVLELGAGCGTASLCLAARVGECKITGVEIDEGLVALARENAAANGMATRVWFREADALGHELRGEFDHVFANPPFHHATGQNSPDERRERAKRDENGVTAWTSAGLKRVRSRGSLTMIVRADRLRDVLVAMPETGVIVFPLWPRSGELAKRVLVQVRKGSSAPLEVQPGLVLHEASGKFTGEAEDVLRGRKALAPLSEPG
jgi:tRNA1Val (adenine37-N6)-methyltransferase